MCCVYVCVQYLRMCVRMHVRSYVRTVIQWLPLHCTTGGQGADTHVTCCSEQI